MPRIVIIWYGLCYVLLGYAAMNLDSHVPDSYSGLAFAVPMIGIPLTIGVTVWGTVTAIKRRRFGVLLGYIGCFGGLFGLMRYIVGA